MGIKAFFIKIVKLLNTNKILTSVLIIAALLRFIGTNPGYNQFHADEGITYSAAVSMIKNGNLDPLRYDYPALVPDINYVFFKLIFIPLSWVKYYSTHILDIVDGIVHVPIAPLEEKTLFQTFVLGDRNLNAMHWGRYVTALFSLLDVLLTFLLARKLFLKNSDGKIIGLIAALFLTFNFKHVINSHIGLPDVYNAFFVLLSFLACVNLWNKPTRKNYILTGLAVGLSFSVKYQIFAVFPFALTHLFSSFEKNKLSFKKLFNPYFILSLCLIPLVFMLTNPYFFIHFKQAIKSVSEVSNKYGIGTKQINLYPLSYWFNIDYGAPLFITALLGILVSFKKFTKETLLIFSYLLPFMFVMIFYSRGGFYVRNFITSTPLIMILAAVGVWFFFNQIRQKFGLKIAGFLLIVFLPIAVFIPGRNAAVNSISYTKPWGYDQMRPWIADNLPKDATVASHPFDAVNLKIKNKRTEFDFAGSWSMEEHKDNGANYAVLDLNWAGYPFYFWMTYGFSDLKFYWNKPLDIMRNTFFGIATEAMFRYQVHAVTKPWQAPDVHLLVIKLPVWPNLKMKDLQKFTFDNDLESWVVRGTYNQPGPTYEYDKNLGHTKNGSVVLMPAGGKFPTVRISSKPIEIKAGYLYKIDGYLKTEMNLGPKEREGFLRVDFYGQEYDPEKVGMIASVSSRVYGTDDWVKKEIVERAPQGAKFLVVSFQSHITTRTKIWLDDVSVQESVTEVEDITAKAPYDIKDIDLNYVYPNSHGNL